MVTELYGLAEDDAVTNSNNIVTNVNIDAITNNDIIDDIVANVISDDERFVGSSTSRRIGRVSRGRASRRRGRRGGRRGRRGSRERRTQQQMATEFQNVAE